MTQPDPNLEPLQSKPTRRDRTANRSKVYPKKGHYGRKLRDDARLEDLDEHEKTYEEDFYDESVP